MDDSMLEGINSVQPGNITHKKRRRVVVSCTECHRRKQKCDRDLPCANCRSRGCEFFCSYNHDSNASNTSNKPTKRPSSTPSHPISLSSTPLKVTEPLSTVAATWGYSQTGASTISCLKKIEMVSPEDQSSISTMSPTYATHTESLGILNKYKDLIRQLPAKIFIDKLVTIFMRQFNWQYYIVDPDVFHTQLLEWNNLPFSIYSTEGWQRISPDLRVFPAVLFQIVATALLLLPDEEETEFATLKYAANMTFEDLACDFSASGADIVGLFGKKSMSVTTVQAEFLRASFLKYTANVTESWHMIGIAIRDAQELGMHRDNFDAKPTGMSLEGVLENQWLSERRRKIYMVLATWDIHMSLILGRPGTVDWRRGFPSLPTDAPVPSDRSKTPIASRNPESDPPTPLTRFLWLHELSSPLRDMHDLEQDGPYPKNFSKIDRLHQKIMSLHDSTPGIFRLENPDTRWDDHPDVAHWIQETRHYFQMFHGFSIMALHRPYVFHRKESRAEALRACLAVLDMQKLMFDELPSRSWRNFMLFFGTFDAIVLIASIYLVFPHDHPDLKHLSVQHIHWAIERFAVLQARNQLARSAQAVLRAVFDKVTKTLSQSMPPSTTSDAFGSTAGAPEAIRTRLSSRPDLNPMIDRTSNVFENETLGSTALNMPAETQVSPSSWALGQHGLSDIMPMYATSDLVYNELTAVQGWSNTIEAADTGEEGGAGGGLHWQFGGNIGDGTVWQMLNRIQPE